jgi:hypothetical protein
MGTTTRRNKTSKKASSTAAEPGSRGSSKTLLESNDIRPSLQHPISPILSKGQLNTLILLAFAVSRILQLGSVTRGGEGEENEPSAECLDHLGLDACRHPTIQSLLLLKYHSALHVLGTALAVIIPMWSSSAQLQRLHSIFLIAPLFLVISVLSFAQDAISQSTKTSNILMGSLLMLLAAPMDYDSIAFLPRLDSRRPSKKVSLQSIALVVMLILAAYDCLTQVRALPTIRQQDQETSSSSSSTPLLRTLASCFAIDRLTEACLYLFAWYEHRQADPNKTSRYPTRTTLLVMAVVHGMDYYYHHHRPHGTIGSDATATYTLPSSKSIHQPLVLSILCGLAWAAPEIVWRPRPQS